MPSEKIVASAIVNNFKQENCYLVLVSQLGLIKRVMINNFADKSFNRAMKCIGLKPNDQLVSANFTNGKA